jgi:hypothetical protein
MRNALGKCQSGHYRRGKVLSGYDLPTHLDRDVKTLSGRTFKEAIPSAYEQVEGLWEARGNVAHGEHAFYRTSGRRIDISDENANDFLNGARACLEWLAALIK